MYRARVDSVSGTKVFAAGKWLQCIGNKNVRVGDYIWTDGRCVYGNNQVPQQPLVITTSDDEGIPILHINYTTITYLSLLKNKLKPIAETNHYSLSEMINNRKGQVFVHKYLAANIDEKGNIFVLKEIKNGDSVAIYKNGSVVREIDLKQFFEDNFVPKFNELERICPYLDYFMTEEIATVREHGWFSGGSYFEVRRAFIEDENNFEIFLYGSIVDNFAIDDLVVANSAYRGFFQIKNNDFDIIQESNDEMCIKGSTYNRDNDERIFVNFNAHEKIHERATEHKSTITGSAGDGFYYKMTPTRLSDEYIFAGGEFRYEYFSPNNEKLLDLVGGIGHKQLFCKVKNDYLVYINNYLRLYEAFGKKDIELKGLYFYSTTNKELQHLSQGLRAILCANNRLRPMKKIKGWPYRIQVIILD